MHTLFPTNVQFRHAPRPPSAPDSHSCTAQHLSVGAKKSVVTCCFKLARYAACRRALRRALADSAIRSPEPPCQIPRPKGRARGQLTREPSCVSPASLHAPISPFHQYMYHRPTTLESLLRLLPDLSLSLEHVLKTTLRFICHV